MIGKMMKNERQKQNELYRKLQRKIMKNERLTKTEKLEMIKYRKLICVEYNDEKIECIREIMSYSGCYTDDIMNDICEYARQKMNDE